MCVCLFHPRGLSPDLVPPALQPTQPTQPVSIQLTERLVLAEGVLPALPVYHRLYWPVRVEKVNRLGVRKDSFPHVEILGDPSLRIPDADQTILHMCLQHPVPRQLAVVYVDARHRLGCPVV